MEIQDFFLQLFIILFAARLFGELAAKFKIPSVIGELFAGVLLGPSLLNLIEPTEVIKLLAEIGIILLLFEVGLETNFTRLKETGIKPFIVAAGGVVTPFVLGYFICDQLFHLSPLVSLLIASTLTATSIGITIRVMADLKRQSSRESQIVLGAAVIDDIIGIILLSVIYEFSLGNKVHYLDVGKIAAFIVLFLLLAPFAAKLISSVIKYYEDKSDIPGLVPASIVSLILFFAWIAHRVGAPELLGGFAAGLALSPQFFPPLAKVLHIDQAFTHKIEYQMKPIIHLFAPIFFVTVGLSLNLREIAWNSSFIWLLSISLCAAAVLGKLASGFLLFKDNRWTKWAVGLAMIPRGEVGLIFAELGRSNKILDNDLYAALLLVIAVTTIFTPFAMRFFYSNYKEPSEDVAEPMAKDQNNPRNGSSR
jgi:Kef-type K+ transport system membrane component KefB